MPGWPRSFSASFASARLRHGDDLAFRHHGGLRFFQRLDRGEVLRKKRQQFRLKTQRGETPAAHGQHGRDDQQRNNAA
jgi:hypothetical protein